MNSQDDLFLPVVIVGGLALLVFVVWASLRNYSECRATPHTAFYCLTHGG